MYFVLILRKSIFLNFIFGHPGPPPAQLHAHIMANFLYFMTICVGIVLTTIQPIFVGQDTKKPFDFDEENNYWNKTGGMKAEEMF